jgi:hypothetical protein
MVRDHIDTLVNKAIEKYIKENSENKVNVASEATVPSRIQQQSGRQIRVEASRGIAKWRNPASDFIRGLGIPVQDQEKKNSDVLVVKTINEGTRPVTINSWGLNISDKTIIPPMTHRCTDIELPARLEDGEALTGWIEYEALKEYGFEFPRDKGNIWVDDATGKRWFCK